MRKERRPNPIQALKIQTPMRSLLTQAFVSFFRSPVLFGSLLITAFSMTAFAESLELHDLEITPYVRKGTNALCASVVIDQSNVIGILSLPLDKQVIRSKLLFRQNDQQNQIEVNLLKEDAENLRREIGALMSQTRHFPLRLSRALSHDGYCTIRAIEDESLAIRPI